jgi:hypothetical protein
VTSAAEWVRGRLGDVPSALLETMLAALPADAALSVPDALAAGALALYAKLPRTGGRDDALPLLAADALFTHALEAQAEADPDGVAGFAARMGAAGALGRMAG